MDGFSALIEHYKLDVQFLPNGIVHTSHFSDPARGIRRYKDVRHWSRLRELGRGSYGEVHLEKNRAGQLRAVKVIHKRDYDSDQVNYFRELSAMAYFSRRTDMFVALHGWFENESSIYIAMEYIENGDLQHCVLDSLPEAEANEIVFQVTEGVQYMHSKHFAHRDLRPSNILVVCTSPGWWVKIGDFGTSKRADGSTRYRSGMRGDYVAPEIMHLVEEEGAEDVDVYTDAVDIWSLGCLSYWLLTHVVPFPGCKGLWQYCLKQSPFPDAPLRAKSLGHSAHDFIQSLMKAQPSQRFSAEQALQSSWLQERNRDL